VYACVSARARACLGEEKMSDNPCSAAATCVRECGDACVDMCRCLCTCVLCVCVWHASKALRCGLLLQPICDCLFLCVCWFIMCVYDPLCVFVRMRVRVRVLVRVHVRVRVCVCVLRVFVVWVCVVYVCVCVCGSVQVCAWVGRRCHINRVL